MARIIGLICWPMHVAWHLYLERGWIGRWCERGMRDIAGQGPDCQPGWKVRLHVDAGLDQHSCARFLCITITEACKLL